MRDALIPDELIQTPLAQARILLVLDLPELALLVDVLVQFPGFVVEYLDEGEYENWLPCLR